MQRVCKEGSVSKCSNVQMELSLLEAWKMRQTQENGFKPMTKLLCIAVADANPLAMVKFPLFGQRKTSVGVHGYLGA